MHDQYHDLLQQYIDGELEMLEAVILEEHLATCQSCRKILNQFKLMDWDLNHQPVVDLPPELTAIRRAAINTHLADIRAAEKKEPAKDSFRLQKQVLQHTFGFISYNPVNRTVARQVSKTVLAITKVAGSRLRKRKPLFSRFSTGQA